MKEKTIEFYGEKLKFYAGHFTIFSATHREKMHGHNYTLDASMTAEVGEFGITFDYNIFRDKLVALCQHLNSRFLLPSRSPHMPIEENDEYYIATFNGKKLFFLKEDALVLLISNVTIEELSSWFIDEMVKDTVFLSEYAISAMSIKVYNTPFQSAQAKWQRMNGK